ncbi:MAG: 1-acyl-sn-glycerol-3-phosphate acyltransferase [Clostridia bacterium]|nr:1-acyl-sn-glycerol-3-phosphate acyltransferase [Clostridia bacterium]
MLLYFFFAFAVLATAVLDVIYISLLPWSLLILVGIWGGLVLTAILFLFFVSLFCYGDKPLEKDNIFCRRLAFYTMDCILVLFRFRISGKGLEKMPTEPCVIVCNHLSRFDPMVTFRLMKGRRLAFVSKIENMRIPIVGPIIRKIGFIPLDRDNPLRAMRSIHTAARLVSEKGFTMGIYPEGTRSRSEDLLEFKTGAFVLAKKANAPLVITRITGTRSYRGRFPFYSTPVTFEVLEVLKVEALAEKKPEELAAYCRSRIAKP